MNVEIHLANQNYQQALETADGYLSSLNYQQVKILIPDILNQKARALIGMNDSDQAYQVLQEARKLAELQNSRRILWALLVDLADLENDPDKTNELRAEARKIISTISDNISDPELRDKFLNLPVFDGVDVRAGLYNVNGDYNLYRNLLITFQDRYQNIMDQIQSEIACNDLETAQ